MIYGSSLLGTGSLATVLGRYSLVQNTNSDHLNKFDCIVIGAGISGLIAARNLVRSGFNVLLLESRERVGGRMYGKYLSSGQYVDLGGQWVGKTHERFICLLDEYKIRRFPSPSKGKQVLLFENNRYEFAGFFQGFSEGEIPKIDKKSWNDAMQAWDRFNNLAKSFPAGHPQANEANKKLDSKTFADWIEKNTTTKFGNWYFSYMARAAGFLGPAEPEEVSLLHVLWGQNCAPQSEHPESDLIHGGAGQIPIKIAEELGERVHLGEPALSIEQDEHFVKVKTPKEKYFSKFVIVAMPPHLAGKITYNPPLPALRNQLTQRVPMGSLAKLLISYQMPFWRNQGLSGIGIGNCQWIELCADSSDPTTGIGVIAAFVAGDRYRKWILLNAEERKKAVLLDLANYFGQSALTPITYDEVNWPAEEYTGGAYAGFMPPGVWTNFGSALTTPVGRIYWSGTEIAEKWPGFFEGAIQTGETNAKLIRNLLLKENKTKD